MSRIAFFVVGAVTGMGVSEYYGPFFSKSAQQNIQAAGRNVQAVGKNVKNSAENIYDDVKDKAHEVKGRVDEKIREAKSSSSDTHNDVAVSKKGAN